MKTDVRVDFLTDCYFSSGKQHLRLRVNILKIHSWDTRIMTTASVQNQQC